MKLEVIEHFQMFLETLQDWRIYCLTFMRIISFLKAHEGAVLQEGNLYWDRVISLIGLSDTNADRVPLPLTIV